MSQIGNGSPEVGGLSVEFIFSGDLKSDKREQ
jgi:hypothetical protein